MAETIAKAYAVTTANVADTVPNNVAVFNDGTGLRQVVVVGDSVTAANVQGVDSLGNAAVKAPDITATGNITTQNLVPAGTATAGSAVATAALDGKSQASIQITGTYTASTGLVVQASVDGSTWVTVNNPLLLNVNTASTSTSIPNVATGIWTLDVSAFNLIRVTSLGTVTGTGVVTIRASVGAGNAVTLSGTANVVDTELGPAAALGTVVGITVAAGPIVGAGGLLYNGATYDLERGNWNGTLSDTATKTVTVNGAQNTNFESRGGMLVLTVGTVTGTTPTMSCKLQGFDGAAYFDIPGATMTTGIVASGTYVCPIYPGLTAASTATSFTCNGVLPRLWRVVYTLGGTSPSFAMTNTAFVYMR